MNHPKRQVRRMRRNRPHRVSERIKMTKYKIFGKSPSTTPIEYPPTAIPVHPMHLHYAKHEDEKVPEELELFMELAEVPKNVLDMVEDEIKNMIKKYNPGLKYDIKYEVDVGENIPKVVIRLPERLPIDEEIKFLKSIWKGLREKGFKKFLEDVEVIVDYYT